MRRTPVLAALTVGAAAILALGVASPAASDNDDPPRLFGGLLTGAKEVLGPGDDDGAAAMLVRVNPEQRRICVIGFETNNIDEPAAFHIHVGTAAVAGPIVVDFSGLLPDGIGCVRVVRPLIRAIQSDPAAYYFNIHNAAFPGGAVRAQLAAFE